MGSVLATLALGLGLALVRRWTVVDWADIHEFQLPREGIPHLALTLAYGIWVTSELGREIGWASA